MPTPEDLGQPEFDIVGTMGAVLGSALIVQRRRDESVQLPASSDAGPFSAREYEAPRFAFVRGVADGPPRRTEQSRVETTRWYPLICHMQLLCEIHPSVALAPLAPISEYKYN